MIIYNITLHIDNEVLADCLLYLKETYIPAALEGKVLNNPQLCRVMGHAGEEGSSYALQFQAENMHLLNEWQDKYGEGLNTLLSERFSDKVIGFTTLLEKLDHSPA